MAGEGKKWDTGKLQWNLLDYEVMDEVVRVLTYGANKYGAYNWEGVEAHRYQAALGRHFSKYMQGESNDDESGINHLAHLIVNAMFLLSKELKEKKEGT